MGYPKSVRIVEVGARDGLQNEKVPVSVETKVAYINKLTDAGFQTIEVGAFVSPKWVPQMADSDKVLAAIAQKPGVSYPVLVPNMKGLEGAIAAGAKEIAVFASASEGFSQKNINCTIAESLERFKPVIEEAQKHGIKVRGYVSCVMGCPYDGDIAPDQVAFVAKALYDMGCYEISLGDTIGVGTAAKTQALMQRLVQDIPVSALAMHCHDTYGRAIECIDVYLQAGGNVVDSSAGGIGSCPFAKGATGNVATETVLGFLASKGIEAGVDAKKAAEAGQFILNELNRPPLVPKTGNGPKM